MIKINTITKKLIVTFLLLLFPTLGDAQEIILPGVGMRDVQLNMSISELTNAIGEPDKILTKMQDSMLKNMDRYVRDLDDFTTALNYDYAHYYSPNAFGIDRVLTQNDSVILFNISASNFRENDDPKMTVSGKVSLGGEAKNITRKFGQQGIVRISNSNFIEYLFLQKGICFHVQDKEISEIVIFGRKNTAQIAALKKEVSF